LRSHVGGPQYHVVSSQFCQSATGCLVAVCSQRVPPFYNQLSIEVIKFCVIIPTFPSCLFVPLFAKIHRKLWFFLHTKISIFKAYKFCVACMFILRIYTSCWHSVYIWVEYLSHFTTCMFLDHGIFLCICFSREEIFFCRYSGSKRRDLLLRYNCNCQYKYVKCV
jgi:hypothetical protein